MLKGQLIHPQILGILGRCGHSSKILIADGNYPFASRLAPKAELVSLNLAPGLVNCTQVLASLLTAMPVEAASVMQYAKSGPYAMAQDPPIWAEFRQCFRNAEVNVELEPVERFAFYDLAGGSDVVMTIATGDQRIYANLLLTVGVVFPPPPSPK